jgi:hypothetical protein
MVDINDIDELLKNWNDAKIEIASLEKKCDKYKKYCEKIMNKLDKNILTGTNFSVRRVDMERDSISKKDVPKDIWNKYSNRTSFSSFYLKQKK